MSQLTAKMINMNKNELFSRNSQTGDEAFLPPFPPPLPFVSLVHQSIHSSVHPKNRLNESPRIYSALSKCRGIKIKSETLL